jgi:hypothetical protein
MNNTEKLEKIVNTSKEDHLIDSQIPVYKEWRPNPVEVMTKSKIQELFYHLGVNVSDVFELNVGSYHIRGTHNSRPFVTYCSVEWINNLLEKIK